MKVCTLVDADARQLHRLFEQDNLVRAIFNTLGIGVIGGAVAVVFYSLVAFAGHRHNDWGTRLLDYLVLLPRAVPGLLAGLAFLWIFLFVPGIKELKNSMWSIWIAYTVVWLAYGMRLIQSALLQVGPNLKKLGEAWEHTFPRESGCDAAARALWSAQRMAADLHDFRARIFDRRLSAFARHRSHWRAACLLWAAGAVDQVAALSVINIAMVSVGLGAALRFGVKLRG